MYTFLHLVISYNEGIFMQIREEKAGYFLHTSATVPPIT